MGVPTKQQILADPNVQAILANPRYTSTSLRDGAVNNYLANDPRSPFRDTFGAEGGLNRAGYPQTGYHYNTQTGRIDETNLYGHPGTMTAVGLGAVGAATGGAALAAYGGAGAAAGGAGSVAGSGAGAAGAAAGGTVAGTAGTAAAVSPWLSYLNTTAPIAASLYGTITQNRANNRASALEQQSAAAQLQFLREQEAQRAKEWQATQDRNYGIYQDETQYGRAQIAQRYGDLAPYRNLGTKAIGQLLQPIVQRPAPGSLATMMGSR